MAGRLPANDDGAGFLIPDALPLLSARVQEVLAELRGCGADPEGGVTRLLYTPQWLEAQRLLQRRMESLHLLTAFDEAGSLFGRLQGSKPYGGTILTGSHIDTVRSGGGYDGAAGIAAALAAVELLQERFGAPKRSIEVVSFCEEEGSRFPLTYWGSGNVTGRYSTDSVPVIADAEGITLEAAMKEAGFGPGTHRPAFRDDLSAFIELHIEQGIVLEREKLDIGVVLGIASQQRWTFTVTGERGHAGTTPMRYRRDALAGACEMISVLESSAAAYSEALVATAGSLEAMPGVSNVVPGEAVFTLDARHPDGSVLEQFCSDTLAEFDKIAIRRGLQLSHRRWMKAEAVPMAGRLCSLIEEHSRAMGLRSRRLHSGAGHDAQMLGASVPSAMLFVPSRAGISHSPLEFTTPEQLARGTAVLCGILYSLAYEEEGDPA